MKQKKKKAIPILRPSNLGPSIRIESGGGKKNMISTRSTIARKSTKQSLYVMEQAMEIDLPTEEEEEEGENWVPPPTEEENNSVIPSNKTFLAYWGSILSDILVFLLMIFQKRRMISGKGRYLL